MVEVVMCGCWHYEFDADATDDLEVPVCACGHVDDEHDEAGVCQAVTVDL